VTAQYSPIIILQMKCSAKQHNELGDNTLTHSVRLFLDPNIPPHFHQIDCQQHLFILLLWQSYRPNQSRNIQCGLHIPLLWGFWILTADIQFYIWFNVCLPVVFAVSWIIQVPIAVELIFSVWTACRWTIVITFGRMVVDLFDSAYIWYLNSSCREVICR